MNQNRSIALWILLLSITFITEGACQISQPFRFEEEVKYTGEGFTVIPLKKEGIALIRDTYEYAHGKKKWRLEVLDTVLSNVWTTELALESRFNLVGYEYSPRHLHLLFREGDNESYNFEVFTIRFHDKEVESSPVKFELNFKLTHFTVAGTSVVFGGNIANEPAVMLWSQTTKQTKVLPGLFISDVSLLDVRMNQNQSFNVLLVERNQKENKKLTVRTYDQEGNLLLEDVILIEGQLSILTGLTSSLENEEMIVAGTYGEGTDRQAIGYFTAVVDPFNEQAVNYTDFSSLTHFTDYLSARRAEKVREKAKKQKDAGHLPDYKAYVSPFRIEERPEGFYLLSELYFPSSPASPYPYGSNYGNATGYGYNPYGISPFSNRYSNSPYSYNNSMRNTDIRTNQTMVMAVGPHGKPGRDVSMKLNELKQSSLEQIGDFIVSRDSICLVYKDESELVYQKMIGDVDEMPTLKKEKIRLQTPSDVLRDEAENEGHVRYWYDKQFFVWGYQTLKDATRSGDHTRHVFYITRFSLD